MQILRIILMVCFVFTMYPSIGVAVDIGEGSKTKSTLKATTSHPLSLNIDPNTNLHVEEGRLIDDFEKSVPLTQEATSSSPLAGQAGDPLVEEAPSANESTHLNERILQLQKKELDKSLDTPTEDDGS